jgi:hypothetical protein
MSMPLAPASCAADARDRARTTHGLVESLFLSVAQIPAVSSTGRAWARGPSVIGVTTSKPQRRAVDRMREKSRLVIVARRTTKTLTPACLN